jgi:hypothetical protein
MNYHNLLFQLNLIIVSPRLMYTSIVRTGMEVPYGLVVFTFLHVRLCPYYAVDEFSANTLLHKTSISIISLMFYFCCVL